MGNLVEVQPNYFTGTISLIAAWKFIQYKNPYIGKDTIMGGSHSDKITIPVFFLFKRDYIFVDIFIQFLSENGDLS